MEAVQNVLSTLNEACRESTIVSSFVFIVVTISLVSLFKAKKGNPPPSLPETIPFVSNSLHYASNPITFWRRADAFLRENTSEIAAFRLFMKPIYFIAGGSNTQELFRPGNGLTSGNQLMMFVRAMWDPPPVDYARFDNDKTGRLKVPFQDLSSDSKGTPSELKVERVWHTWHQMPRQFLESNRATNELLDMFEKRFVAKLDDRFPEAGKWTEIRVNDWLNVDMSEAAGVSLSGTKFLEMYPDFFKLMREVESALLPIALGPPRWLNPGPYRIRDRWFEMQRTIMKAILEEFDWDGPMAKESWTPLLGAAFPKELVKWLYKGGWSHQVISAGFGIQILNMNSNTVPAAVWAIMDMLSAGPEFVARVKEEAESALLVGDGGDDGRRFDMHKLGNLPLLQAIYVETLRMHVSMPLNRQAIRDTTLAGHDIPKGAWIQAPSLIAHNDPIWTADGHPPEEFWPDRHLVENEKTGKVEFSMQGRSNFWFPYGGSITICPGRAFARLEIMMTIAILVTSFDIDVLGWTSMDGKTESTRPAKNSQNFVTMWPDRDLKIRVRKRV